LDVCQLAYFIFNIFQTPDPEVIILSLHFNSQNKNIKVFVFFKIFVNPVISSPTFEAPINFKSKEIVTQGTPFAAL
jgi:hypothetical protein